MAGREGHTMKTITLVPHGFPIYGHDDLHDYSGFFFWVYTNGHTGEKSTLVGFKDEYGHMYNEAGEYIKIETIQPATLE